MKFKELDIPKQELLIGSRTFVLKIASTKSSRTNGLSKIDSLPVNAGLFFWYGETRYPNAMPPNLNPSVIMCIPFNLTVLFLRKDGTILQIFKDLKGEPKKNIETATQYCCNYPSDLMIELSSKDNIDVNVGDVINIKSILQII